MEPTRKQSTLNLAGVLCWKATTRLRSFVAGNGLVRPVPAGTLFIIGRAGELGWGQAGWAGLTPCDGEDIVARCPRSEGHLNQSTERKR
jgi:hypothetical protein